MTSMNIILKSLEFSPVAARQCRSAHAQRSTSRCDPKKPTAMWCLTRATAIEVDWAIDRRLLPVSQGQVSFRERHRRPSFLVIRVLAGWSKLPHEDEYFGKQQVYREISFTSRSLTRVDGDRPETAWT